MTCFGQRDSDRLDGSRGLGQRPGCCTQRWDTRKRDRHPSRGRPGSARGQLTIGHLGELQPNPVPAGPSPPRPAGPPRLPRRCEQERTGVSEAARFRGRGQHCISPTVVFAGKRQRCRKQPRGAAGRGNAAPSGPSPRESREEAGGGGHRSGERDETEARGRWQDRKRKQQRSGGRFKGRQRNRVRRWEETDDTEATDWARKESLEVRAPRTPPGHPESRQKGRIQVCL